MLSHRTLIIGVDPGKTCGYAYLDTGNESFQLNDLSYVDAVDFLAHQAEWARNAEVRCIISVERFIITGTRPKTNQTEALRFIGAAEYLARVHRHKFQLNGVSDAQRIGSPTVLRTLGWWAPGRDHCNKAAAQVAYALALAAPDEFERITRV